MNIRPSNSSLPRPPRPRIPVWQRKLGIPEHSLPSNQSPVGLLHRAAQISANQQKPYQRPGRHPDGPIRPVRPPAPPEASSKAVPLPLVKKELLDMISIAQEKLKKEREAILKNMQQNKVSESNGSNQLGKLHNTLSGREGCAVHNLERSQLGRGRDVMHNSNKSGLLASQLNTIPSITSSSGGPQILSGSTDLRGSAKPVLGMHGQGGFVNARFPGPGGKLPVVSQPARYCSASEQGDRQKIEIVSTQSRAPRLEKPHSVGQRQVVGPADAQHLKNRPYGVSHCAPPKPVYSGLPSNMPVPQSCGGAPKGPGDQHMQQRPVSDWQRPNGWLQGGSTASGQQQSNWNSSGGNQQHDRSFGGGHGTTGASQWQYSQVGFAASQLCNLVMFAQQALQAEYSYLSGGHR